MDFNRINKELFSFLDNSPNAFFAVKNMCDILNKNGMTRLYEGKPWDLESGKGYYVTRNDSAIIAFRIPKNDYKGFMIMASHCPTSRSARLSGNNPHIRHVTLTMCLKMTRSLSV